MQRSWNLLAAACLSVMGLAWAVPGPVHATTNSDASESEAPLPDVPYSRFTLPNGLTVVVSEDHKAPVVGVAMWYHVGSAREPDGKSGYAHLFEHLMFERSGHHDGNYFEPFEKAGATDMNGTTASDRTNYFETVPRSALDMALWMESDRMGWLLDGLAKDEVNQQRGVVQNEKRQGENQPYGRVRENILANAYPANHPYHHTTIGSMSDLNAASVDDFKHWFQRYYGPNNATLVMVGDITPDEARAKATTYFGNIEPGPAVADMKPWVFPRDEDSSGTMHEDVPQARLYREWNTPQDNSKADGLLTLAADILGGGKTSRLYQRLVYEDDLADDVSVYQASGELGSQFQLRVDITQGVDKDDVKSAIADVWQTFLDEGPTADELARVKTDQRARVVRRLQRVGGFSGKATMLAAGQVYNNDPASWREELKGMLAATPDQVRDAARQWLGDGAYTLAVLPLEKGETATTAKVDNFEGLGPVDDTPEQPEAEKQDFHTVKTDVDRSKGVPEVTDYPDLKFPRIQHATLDNGIKVTLAERHNLPLIDMSMQFDSGYAADRDADLGRANFTMDMLDEGTDDLSSLDIARTEQALGANINTGCGLDTCTVSLNALTDKLGSSLDLYADIVQNPVFDAGDLNRVRGQRLSGIAHEKSRPMTLALRVLPPLLYGEDHPYGMPFTGSGTTDSVKDVTADDMRTFMTDYIRPDNVSIQVAGDIGMGELVDKLNAAFADWKAPDSAVPDTDVPDVESKDHARVYLMDRPGSLQSIVLAGDIAPSTKVDNNLAIETMNSAFGGTFTSRLNMNLREDKHWAYGAHSLLPDAMGQRPFLIYAPVQTDKTAPSVKEALSEARAINGDEPLTHDEITKVKKQRIHGLPGRYETIGSVLGELQDIARYDRPDDYVQTLKSRLQGLSDDQVQSAADEVIDPGHFTWMIVGDLDKVGDAVRDLDLGPVQELDENGDPVDEGASD